MLACEVTYFALTGLGKLEFEWTLLPEMATIVNGRSWDV
jgi:hypothetical protein